MTVQEVYSHLNGLEYLLVHRKSLWESVLEVVRAIDATACRIKQSKENGMVGKMLYSPVEMNREFSERLVSIGWKEERITYWVTKDERLIRRTLSMTADEQKIQIENAGETPILSYNQTDFVKDRVALLKFNSASTLLSPTTSLSNTWPFTFATKLMSALKYYL